MVITCQQAEEWIEQALEGTLPPRQAQMLDHHLAECPRCKRRFEREQRAAAALRGLPGQAPAGLPQRVVAALPAVSPQALGQIAGVLRRAGEDPRLRQRLRADPRATLAALGVALPAGLRIEVTAQQPAPLPTADTLLLPLPEAPLQIEPLEQRLAATSLGALFGFWW